MGHCTLSAVPCCDSVTITCGTSNEVDVAVAAPYIGSVHVWRPLDETTSESVYIVPDEESVVSVCSLETNVGPWRAEFVILCIGKSGS